jgi:hypothetical protein
LQRGSLRSVKLIMRRAVLICLASTWLQAQDPAEIIRRSIDRDFNNFDRLKNYTYQEREENREFDAGGRVKKTEVETRDILILGGRPYHRVIARDDKPLSEKDARKEQEKMDRVASERENESAAERAKRDKARAEGRKFLAELPDAYSFRLVGEEAVSGKPAWIIEADPKTDFRPKDARSKILSKVKGKVWIEKSEYQWVKAEAEVLDTLSFGLALFRLAPGGLLEFEQTRVNDEVWLPAHMLIRADARFAYVKKVRAEVEVNYRDYKKFQAESRMVP